MNIRKLLTGLVVLGICSPVFAVPADNVTDQEVQIRNLAASGQSVFTNGSVNQVQPMFNTNSVTPQSVVAAVPEPSSLALLGLGMIGLTILRRRMR